MFRISTNGDFNILFSDLTLQKFCSAGNGVVFVDVLAKQRIAHQSICNSKVYFLFLHSLGPILTGQWAQLNVCMQLIIFIFSQVKFLLQKEMKSKSSSLSL